MPENTDNIKDAKPILSANRLYNIVFPSMILSSLLYLIYIIFITPTEGAIETVDKGVSVNSLRQVQKQVGTVSMFGLKDPRSPGALTGKSA
jgi:hypothetical protein